MKIEEKLYLQGESIYDIAKIVGISPTGVWKRLKAQGVTLRKNGLKGKPWAIKKRGLEYIGADGRWWVRGVNSKGKKNAKHRAVIVMEKIIGGPIPKGYHVHHKDEDIQNDSPDNLELKKSGTHTRDHHLGKKNPAKGAHNRERAKLSEKRVEKIRKVYATGKYSQQQIADKVGVHQTMISAIVTGRSWR